MDRKYPLSSSVSDSASPSAVGAATSTSANDSAGSGGGSWKPLPRVTDEPATATDAGYYLGRIGPLQAKLMLARTERRLMEPATSLLARTLLASTSSASKSKSSAAMATPYIDAAHARTAAATGVKRSQHASSPLHASSMVDVGANGVRSSIGWAPDSRSLITNGDGKRINIWDTERTARRSPAARVIINCTDGFGFGVPIIATYADGSGSGSGSGASPNGTAPLLIGVCTETNFTVHRTPELPAYGTRLPVVWNIVNVTPSAQNNAGAAGAAASPVATGADVKLDVKSSSSPISGGNISAGGITGGSSNVLSVVFPHADYVCGAEWWGSGDRFVTCDERNLLCWDLERGASVVSWTTDQPANSNPERVGFIRLAVSVSQSLIAAGSRYGSIFLYDPRVGGRRVGRMTVPAVNKDGTCEQVVSMCAFPGGLGFGVGCMDGLNALMECRSLSCVNTYFDRTRGAYRPMSIAMAFSGTGQYLYTGTDGDGLTAWDTVMATPAYSVHPDLGRVNMLSVRPDGTALAATEHYSLSVTVWKPNRSPPQPPPAKPTAASDAKSSSNQPIKSTAK